MVRWALAAVTAGTLFGATVTHAGAVSDSTGEVRRISVSDRGIVIEREPGRATSGGAGHRRVHRGVSIRNGIVEIGGSASDSADTGSVEVIRIGHGIHVGTGDEDRVRMFSDVEVRPGEHVDGDVVALFGSVDVKGQVSGNVVAVFGSVKMTPGAIVDGDAVAVGGVLEQPQGAVVNGESVSLSFLPLAPTVPPVTALMLLVVAGWLASLVAGWILWLIFPGRMLRVAVSASRHTGWSVLLGLLLPPLAVVACVLLLVTIIGIPLAFLMPLFVLFVGWAGQIAAVYLLGCRLLRRPLGSPAFLPIFVGSLLVAALLAMGGLMGGPQGALRTLALFFPILGGLLLIGLGVIGSGAVLYSGFGARPAEIRDPEQVATGAGTAPAAGLAAAAPPATPPIA
jgi:hypothetical protein